jgi:hypothetical protein
VDDLALALADIHFPAETIDKSYDKAKPTRPARKK